MIKYKKIIKIAAWILVLCLIAVLLMQCSKHDFSKNQYRNINTSLLSTQTLSSSGDLELSWDEDAKAVFCKSLSQGGYWSDILYEKFKEGSESAKGNSPIAITVTNTKTLKWDTTTSFEQFDADKCSITCKKIPDGVRVTYFFSTYKIAVPIEYTLREDSVLVTLNCKNILENGDEYKLVSVTLTPNLCSLKNDTENGYLFVPSGCGALMNTAENSTGTRSYSGEVYGDDGARRTPTDFVEDEMVRMPVFGASGAGRAMLGIIEKGAGSAVIEAQAGDERLGYSTVGAKFFVRGYDKFFFTYHGKPQGTTNRVNDDITNAEMSVGYYPLYGDDADYAGMAKRYRDYLTDNKILRKSKVEDSPYSVTLLGGTGVTKSILGVPKKEINALTTFAGANDIITDIVKNNKIVPVVRMLGYGDKGLRPGSIAGGKNFLSVYGSKNDLSELLKKFPDIFVDFDIVSFSKSGNGFSLSSDTSKTAIKYRAEHFAITPTRIMDKNNPYYIIARSKLNGASEKAISKAKDFGITSVSLSTLGSIAFSDYSAQQYVNKNGIENDVTKILNNVKRSCKRVSVSKANVYAAGCSDVIFDVPTTSGDYNSFDKEIPFYQMVFHSYKTLYGDSVNTSDNPELAVAKSLAYGMGVSFMLTDTYVADSDDLSEYPLYGTLYTDNKDLIKNSVILNGFSSAYKETANSKLKDYKILQNGLSVSTFENGTVIYSNLTDSEILSSEGNFEPYEFKIG